MAVDFSFAEHVLQHLGFNVKPIDTGDEESADWIATLGDDIVLVEEKTKQEDPDEVARRYEAFAEDLPFDSHTPFKPDSRLSGITRKAVGQLGKSAALTTHSYRFVWFTATGHSHEAKFHQYITTLYGSTNILERSNVPMRRCYFFRNSEFFRHRDRLDGAIVAESDGEHINLKLCLNPLSPKFQMLKTSATCRAFGTAVLDPLVDEDEGGAFIVDCDIDRSRESELLQYLQEKYGTDCLMNIDMGMSSVSVIMK